MSTMESLTKNETNSNKSGIGMNSEEDLSMSAAEFVKWQEEKLRVRFLKYRYVPFSFFANISTYY